MTVLSGNLRESFPRLLRDEALREVEAQGLDVYSLAEKLDVFPGGARRILSREDWSPELGLRVLGALGLTVDVKLPDNPSHDIID